MAPSMSEISINDRASSVDYRCPACHSLIYSRRHKKCVECGVSLPRELLLTDEQIRAFDEQTKQAKKRIAEFDSTDGGSGG